MGALAFLYDIKALCLLSIRKPGRILNLYHPTGNSKPCPFALAQSTASSWMIFPNAKTFQERPRLSQNSGLSSVKKPYVTTAPGTLKNTVILTEKVKDISIMWTPGG